MSPSGFHYEVARFSSRRSHNLSWKMMIIQPSSVYYGILLVRQSSHSPMVNLTFFCSAVFDNHTLVDILPGNLRNGAERQHRDWLHVREQEHSIHARTALAFRSDIQMGIEPLYTLKVPLPLMEVTSKLIERSSPGSTRPDSETSSSQA